VGRRAEGHIEAVYGPDGKQRKIDGLPVWRLEVPTVARPGQRRGRIRKNVAGTRADARTALRDLLSARDHGHEPLERVTVDQLVARWRSAQASRWKPTTAARHKSNLEHYILPRIGNQQAKTVTTDDVNRLYAHAAAGVLRPLSPRSVQSVHETLRALFAFGVEIDAVPSNPVSKARPPKQRTRRREPLTDEVVAEIIAAAPGVQQQALLRLLAVTGARPNEACALRWSAVELDADPPQVRFRAGLSSGVDPATGTRVVKVEGTTKTDDDRAVVVDPVTAELLRRLRVQQIESAMSSSGTFNQRGFVFPGRDDRGLGEVPVGPGSVGQMFRRVLAKLGYEGRWELYDLKRWSSTAAAEDGASVRSVMARLGHTNPRTTLGYQQGRAAVDAQIARGLGRRLSGE
jgi:integrase